MNYSDYRKRELEISKQLNKYVLDFCNENPEYQKVGEIYSSKEIHLNGIQFVAGFEASKRAEFSWKEYIAVPIIIELIMIWAYKTNQIIDHKKNIWNSNEKIISNVLDHDVILSCILSLIEDLKPRLKNKHNVISTYLFSLLKDLPLGFLLEKQSLNINSSNLAKIIENWEQNYITRNIKFNSLYDFAPMIGYHISSGIDVIPEYKNNISDSKKFSHIGQIINDLSDCIPQNDSFEKSYQDQYADIRNGIITYPVFQLLELQSTKDALRDKKVSLDRDWQKEYFNNLIEKNIVKDIKDMAKESYDIHIDFWRSILGDENDFLNRTYGLLLDNKYFKQTHVPSF